MSTAKIDNQSIICLLAIQQKYQCDKFTEEKNTIIQIFLNVCIKNIQKQYLEGIIVHTGTNHFSQQTYHISGTNITNLINSNMKLKSLGTCARLIAQKDTHHLVYINFVLSYHNIVHKKKSHTGIKYLKAII
jgi:hypothetical protein